MITDILVRLEDSREIKMKNFCLLFSNLHQFLLLLLSGAYKFCLRLHREPFLWQMTRYSLYENRC
jgi:hypothetical protein